MLIEAQKLNDGSSLAADLCIVGAGAAGLALSDALIKSGMSIILLDSGHLRDDKKTRGFIAGSNATDSVFNLSGQRRRIGGGTNDWSGNCSLLNESDFSLRTEQCQWPISFDELAKTTSDVEEYLALDKRFHKGVLASTSVADEVTMGNESYSSQTKLRRKRFFRSKVKFPDVRFKQVLESKDMLVVTGATIGHVELDDSGKCAESVSAYNGGKRIKIKAKKFVLASGLENAPIMLRTMESAGYETEKRLPALGRYLHSHLLSLRGFLVSSRESAFFLNWSLPGDLGEEFKRVLAEFNGLQISDMERIKQQLLNGVMFLAPVNGKSLLMNPMVLEKSKQFERLNDERSRFAVRHFIEQPPRWESKVTLGGIRGHSPFKRAVYHWSVGDQEQRTIDKHLQLLAKEVELFDVGKVEPISCGEEEEPNILLQNCHPMGGTVMGDSVKHSVVDQNCKVHGMENLYIVGGSVIPRSGACMVTGVILQLSLRLAKHLMR